MKVQNQAAYILHQRPYRDTSQIIELFSREHGRLALVSRGSRGPKSKSKAIMQAFRPLYVSWSGKSDLQTLTAVEAAQASLPVLTGKSLPSAFYINELLMRLLHRHDVYTEVYDLYENTLYRLSNVAELENTLRIFEKDLLQHLGFGVNLSIDADSGNQVQENLEYVYYLEHGPVLASSSIDEQHQLVIKGSSLLAYENGRLDSDEARKDIKSLMRYILSHYLNGKPLKSRELFR